MNVHHRRCWPWLNYVYSVISTFGNEHFNHNQFVKKVIFTNVVFRIFEDLVRKVNKLKNLIAKTLIALGYLVISEY